MTDYEQEIYKISNPPLQASFGPINTIISAFMAKDIILYLALGYNENINSIGCRCGLNFTTLEFCKTRFNESLCDCWGEKNVL